MLEMGMKKGDKLVFQISESPILYHFFLGMPLYRYYCSTSDNCSRNKNSKY